jgi:hypothetical protein
MKILMFVTILALSHCNRSKTTTANASGEPVKDSAVSVLKDNASKKDSTILIVTPQPVKDSIVKTNVEEKKSSDENLPLCIKTMITKFKSEDVTNPPMKIYSYTYKGKKVYYVPGPCCDNFSDLYDENCKLLGHPDGGFTGRGDGKMPNFKNEITNEKLIWGDTRGKK